MTDIKDLHEDDDYVITLRLVSPTPDMVTAALSIAFQNDLALCEFEAVHSPGREECDYVARCFPVDVDDQAMSWASYWDEYCDEIDMSPVIIFLDDYDGEVVVLIHSRKEG